jgi:hypothetical protein
MTSTLRPSPSAPVFTNLKIQATRSPRVKDRPEKCSHGAETPKLAAVPLVSHQVIVQLIGATTTETGLKVCCEIDANLYPKGVKVSDPEMQAINITRDEFHGEWNYTISPNQQPP